MIGIIMQKIIQPSMCLAFKLFIKCLLYKTSF